jgi:tetraacyldisaccharide 4'-kinase
LETVRVPVPVFCVGNLTVGGAGKTPGVIWLVEELKRRGRRPAVVSRGYGRRSGAVVLVDPLKQDLPGVEEIGDEPRLLARRLGVPVGVGADRARVAERVWEAFKPDCLVMDDGFQHFRLHRDRDLVCLDARQGYRVFVKKAAAPLLPAGPWREPLAGFSRAALVLLTRSERLDDKERGELLGTLRRAGIPCAPVAGRLSFRDNGTGKEFPAEKLKGFPVLALSGLGDPASFEEALARRGANAACERHADHHFFSERDLRRALDRARREGRRIVVTEKDMERLPEDFPALVARLTWKVLDDSLWPSVIESVFS